MDRKSRSSTTDATEDERREDEAGGGGFAGLLKRWQQAEKPPWKVQNRYREHVKNKLGMRSPARPREYRDYRRLLFPTVGKRKGLR
eukprot:1529323-Heterocapsa_arctica.AAC.1